MNWTLKRVELSFEDMEESGWNTTIPMIWGFRFFDQDVQKLENTYDELKNYEYKLEKLEFNSSKKTNELYVSKVEILTPKELLRRYNSLNGLAEYMEIETFGDWDARRTAVKDIVN